jgi:hypothetical protein
MTRSEWVSTLPPWRRLLAWTKSSPKELLNWRPVYDIEQETERLRIASLESEKRLRESEKRLKLLEQEDKRLAELESRLEPCCSMPIPPRRHRPQPAPTE